MASGSSGSGLIATKEQKLSISDLACHEGKRIVSWKVRHAPGSIRRLSGRGPREAVDEGSKPAEAGVFNALRFWVIESSIELRDNLRKSRAHTRQPRSRKDAIRYASPLKAVVEKQNWGVRPGLSCLSATATAESAPGRDILEAPETDPSLVVHKNPATVVGILGTKSNDFAVIPNFIACQRRCFGQISQAARVEDVRSFEALEITLVPVP